MKPATFITYALLLILTSSVTVFGFLAGQDVPLTSQWPLFEALRTTASIVFAVIGAWLAIIYPERLKFSFTGVASKKVEEKSIGNLFTPAISSTFILAIVLLYGVMIPILKNIPFLIAHKDVFRGLSYALLCILTFWQLWTILLTLTYADIVKTSSDIDDMNKSNRDHYSQ